jgi:hypothetical protein
MLFGMETTGREKMNVVGICFGKKPLGTKEGYGSIDTDKSHIKGKKIEFVNQ